MIKCAIDFCRRMFEWYFRHFVSKFFQFSSSSKITPNRVRWRQQISGDEKSNSNNQIASDQKKKKTFKCELCQYYSSIRSNLNFHIVSVHEGKKSFKCENCGKSFTTKSYMNQHVASVHEAKKNFKCEFCEKTYNKKYLPRHIKEMHEGKKWSMHLESVWNFRSFSSINLTNTSLTRE